MCFRIFVVERLNSDGQAVHSVSAKQAESFETMLSDKGGWIHVVTELLQMAPIEA
jgi:hypothetical protein